MNTIAEILPCPFCASRNVLIEQSASTAAVICYACGGIGPVGEDTNAAVMRWNSRSALASSFRCAVEA